MALALGLCFPASGWSGLLTPAAASVPPTPGKDAVEELLRQVKEIKSAQPQQALEKGRQALALAHQLGNGPQELAALHQVGGLLIALNDYEAATSIGTDGLILAKKLGNHREEAEFHLLLSSALWGQGDLPGAADQAIEYLHDGEAMGDKVIQQQAEETLGIVCASNEDFQGARQHFEASLRLAEESHSPHLGRLFMNLGDACQRQKDYPQARMYLERALPICREAKEPTALAGELYSLGEVTSLMGDQVQAARYLAEAMTAARDSRNDLFVAHIYRVMAAVDRRSGRLDAAWDQLQQSLALADKLKNVDLSTQLYDECIQTAKARNDYRAALDYTDRLTAVNETVRSEKSRLKVAELEHRYEAQGRLNKIALLERDRELQRSELTLQKIELSQAHTQRYALGAVVLCAGLAAAAWIGRQRAHARLTQQDLVETRAAKQQVEQADAQKAHLLTVAAQDLRESEARFRSAFENSPLGIALVSLAGEWLRINPALGRILGHEPSATLAKTVQDFTCPDDLAQSRLMLDRLAEGGADSYHLEQRFIQTGGAVVWARVDASVVRETATGKPLYLILQVQDITEKKRADEVLIATKQEAEHANAAKSEFLSRVSHELRTPLNAIIGFGQLLRIEEVGASAGESIDHILRAGHHLLELIDGLLDISRIETGRVLLTCQPTSVGETVRKAIALARPLAEKSNVRITFEPPGQDGQVQADPWKLTQVLLNLLSNAVKYNGPDGQVIVRCEKARQGCGTRITVRDTGVGIAEQDQPLVFAPFVRLAATNGVPGTGLGLSLSKVLIEAMGGRIGLESVPGQGSTFWVELNDAEEEEDAFAQPAVAPSPQKPAADEERTTVLYIEDNLDNLRLVEKMLSYQPHIRLIPAMQGSLGLELAKEHRPDLILLDLHLPDMPGVNVVKALRQRPETAATPVIVISADATFKHLEALQELGIHDYMTKPYDLDGLSRAIALALEQGPPAATS